MRDTFMNKRISDEDMAKVSGGGGMEIPTVYHWHPEDVTCPTCGMFVEAGAKICSYCNDPILDDSIPDDLGPKGDSSKNRRPI